MYEMLAALLAEEFGLDTGALTPDATFRRLELDSLSLAELAVLVADRTGVFVADADLTLDSTLAEAAERFAAAQAPSGTTA